MDKNFNLGHNYIYIKPLKIEISYVYSLWQDLSHGTIIFTLLPWPWSLTYFWKTLTLDITFKPEVIRLSYCTCVFLVTRPFTRYHIFYLVTLTLKFDPLMKNFNLDCYLMMVAARWASLSSDNSYYSKSNLLNARIFQNIFIMIRPCYSA